ncbi:Septal ring factor EnvC, activator of murein hydrolases AmiA and AmiB [Desulfuromusa kysingii]|uniref:Septal ring factor EnvC, activator of murein hydrolases AmiA and AmiB n=1 Tax=Desulfuromusa kysingii TaxID=37625 RepID=A0A1H3YR37_9BACT|nr:peptidoglycan DD-metalloendopeptidase family protein [Desulfuromusa kysingii]SEA13492.1 Septal ring factor EnvC, activator of murein hydrolases AmiA and AmiB [Desulfuromusa kysingii]
MGFLAASLLYVVSSVFNAMNRSFSFLVSCCLLLILLVTSSLADLSNNHSQLEDVEARINRAEADLQNKKKSELSISRELALINKNLEQVKKRITALKANVKKLEKEIQQQRRQVRENETGVKKVTLKLEKRLVALYKEGDTGVLKILFSAESPTEMVQQYQYFTKVLQYDKELLAEYRETVKAHQQKLATLEALRLQKNELLESEHQQQLAVKKGQKLQSRLLKQAQADKKKLSSELAQLKEDARKLKALISRLQVEENASVSSAPAAGNFISGRGKLSWPVNGRVVIGFGKQKDDKLGTYYESNGIEIATAVGSPIQVVASGKVVFADYFKGYGNLFILSHPGGYHTLYAQVDRMHKKLGEQVAAGDLLGYSGLGGRDSIYFEIRSKGVPVNPLSWLQPR